MDEGIQIKKGYKLKLRPEYIQRREYTATWLQLYIEDRLGEYISTLWPYVKNIHQDTFESIMNHCSPHWRCEVYTEGTDDPTKIKAWAELEYLG